MMYEEYYLNVERDLSAREQENANVRARAEFEIDNINITLTKEEAEFLKELLLTEQWHNLRIREEDEKEYKITSSILKKLGYEEG